MGQMTTTHAATSVATTANDADLIRVLGQSLYPGAKPDSIALVLGYCRAAGLDPMLKPVHIVPMWDGNARQMRDVIMPGIGHYRVQASRSGQYVGKSEPEFGPDQTAKIGSVGMTFPQWCKVTVRRKIGGVVAEFTAIEFWMENYATAGRDKPEPNAMWRKRPYGQLAKVAEAQALRQAFPELLGAETAEEMEGKEINAGAEPRLINDPQKAAPKRDAKAQLDSFANVKKPAQQPDEGVTIDGEIVDGETGEVEERTLPEMPEQAAKDWSNKKWSRGWKWFSDALPKIDPEHRQFFWTMHKELLAAVSAYNQEANSAVALLAEQNGVKIE